MGSCRYAVRLSHSYGRASSSWSSARSGGTRAAPLRQVGPRPLQAFERVTLRIVFASHVPEYPSASRRRSRKSLILPVPGSCRSGTSASWIWPMREQPLHGAREVAFHDLHVEVVLHEGVALPAAFSTSMLARSAYEEARHGTRVDRLEREAQAGSAELARRVAHVFHQHAEVLAIRGRHAGQAIQPRTACQARILDRPLDPFAEFALASRQAGDTRAASRRSRRPAGCEAPSTPASRARRAISSPAH